MYSYLVSFSVIVYSITLVQSEINETLKIMYNGNMFDWVGDLPTHPNEKQKNDFFYTMSKDDRIKYCNEAKDFAGLDAVTPITHTPLKCFTPSDTVVLACKTLPHSYLYKQNSSHDYISIMMKENTFFKYNYEVLIAKSEPILYSRNTGSSAIQMSVADLVDVIRSTSFDNDRYKEILNSDKIADFLTIIETIYFEERYLLDNRLSKLQDNEAMQVCTAAKQHLRKLAAKDVNAYNVPVLQNDRVEPAQILDFGEKIGSHVALHCPSSPSMYVYFKNPKIPYTKDLKIVLVQN